MNGEKTKHFAKTGGDIFLMLGNALLMALEKKGLLCPEERERAEKDFSFRNGRRKP